MAGDVEVYRWFALRQTLMIVLRVSYLRPLQGEHVEDVEVVEALAGEAAAEEEDGVAAAEGGVGRPRRGHAAAHARPLPPVRRGVVAEQL